MQSLETESCPDCSVPLLDAWDELACPNCGMVKEKAGTSAIPGSQPRQRYGPHPLGSFMGTMWGTRSERATKGITGSSRNYGYLKTVSDFTGREDGQETECAKMIERVAEKLALPRFVGLQAAAIARKVSRSARTKRRMTVAEISAYSLMAACRIEGVTSSNAGEILAAHAVLGRRVTTSSIIQLSLDSPVRTFAKGPEDYVTRVLAKLSMNPNLDSKLARAGVAKAAYFNAVRSLALDLLSRCDRVSIAGRRPCALAASAVYSAEAALAMAEGRGRRVTQREVADCGGTSEYTIREQCAMFFTSELAELAKGL
jgi:transcription initiation factor TFIIIB Brf1 subunit/transcription initiation factor TFIIB